MFFHWLTNTPAGSMMFLAIGIVLLFLGYFFPVLLAFALQTPHLFRLFVVNALLGWTVIGWISCLVWALYASTHSETFDGP